MIRPGSLEDAAAMAEIFNLYVATSNVIFSEHILSPEEMGAKLKPVVDGGFPFVVWEEDGRILGYCYAHLFHPDPVYGRTWEITIYLRGGSTGRGIGSALLGRVIGDSRDAGAHTLVSFVTGGNEPCEKLHLAHGFERIGVLRQAGFKMGQFWDDGIFQMFL